MKQLEPTGAMLAWAARQVAESATAVVINGLREGGNPWLLWIQHDGRTSEAVLKVADPNNVAGFASEVAALRVAEKHHIPAPVILGLDTRTSETSTSTSTRIVLETVVPGHSTIPVEPTPARLRALGAAAAALYAVAVAPSPDLPIRTRPIPASDFIRQRRLGTDHTTSLLQTADARLSRLPVPTGRLVFVHGDLWQGNMLWDGDTLAGIVDWDMAGVGHHGIDLSSLRLDAALMFGCEAAEAVLAGWERTTGKLAPDLAFWDATAALNMPGDLAVFVPAIHDQGRRDLTASTLNERRDTFLGRALDRL
ncbi:Predicted kinase, aminoglycoside phosphotransferase (APT) family [Micromonospora pallida]|uniref:Predicted kinase, aminoglycoside phosphotransferase (APT) family n=1 Tax=Micromonospora pallida TaxID=145854 RepID=A0A1C6RKM9_9ACTN|nr:aminoglycoside phosphotransferase family protein [Micromonospora pallida]SCL17658.1 Predicted kinase, aminoglycoside phosphotransferase (APT) family [Micromonospora pallida]